MSLLYANQQITIYLGIFLVIIGVIGNSLNIFIFSSIRSYRRTSCSFYFLVNSIDNLFFLLIILISRIVSVGFNIDLTRTSTHWCKLRQYFIIILGSFSFICSCLSSIDQFFVTSRNVHFRRLSNIKWTHRIVFILIIVCCLHGIIAFMFSDISSITKTCLITNSAFSIYISVYAIGLNSFGPILIMSIFGYLTYRNIHSIRTPIDQRFDRQLFKMTLFQVLLVLITVLPCGIITSYMLVTSTMVKDSNQIIIETFAVSFLSLICYFYYAGSCYAFLISSSRFRRTVKDKLFFWKKLNQINPTTNGTI